MDLAEKIRWSPPCAPLTHPVRGAAGEEVPDDGAGVPAAADAEAEAVAVVMQHHHLHLRPLALQLQRQRKGEEILHLKHFFPVIIVSSIECIDGLCPCPTKDQ